jgi:inner membrane protein
LLSTAYLAWGVAAQAHVERVARDSLAAQGINAEQVLVTPTAFNSVLWRVVALAGPHYHEGFYSLFDAEPRITFDRFERGVALSDALQDIEGVQRITAFSKGFYKLHADDTRLFVTDLRMGQEPSYIFTFAVAERNNGGRPLASPEQLGARMDLRRGLSWLWRRAWGELLPPPR